MIIIHKVSDFLFDLFPKAKEMGNSLDALREELTGYYTIPGKEFTGLQLLAYMYAAFQVIDPFLDTGMNFKKEYETAKEKLLEMD
jgi:hypothetical protein